MHHSIPYYLHFVLFLAARSKFFYFALMHVECCDGRWMVQILNTIHVTTKAHFELVCSDFVYVRDFILTDEAVILLLTLLIVSRSYSHTPLSCVAALLKPIIIFRSYAMI